MTKDMHCSCTLDSRSRRDALMLLAALGAGIGTATAQDPAKVEPRSYRVVLENDKVRVLEYTARPGLGVCGVGRHSHPDHVAVALTPAKVKVTPENGKTFVADLKAGSAFWEPAETHMAENIGGSGSRCLLIEIKDKDWKPSTG
jgi:quercetin dioxygenase-like cupin family protein